MLADQGALAEGELRVEGQLTAASNATLLCTVVDTGELCVYKPQAGERDLWDFPANTLARRELAACALAQALGWPLIPETVWRERGPFGPGMCQRWIEGDADVVVVTEDDLVPRDWHVVLRGQDPQGKPVTLAHTDRSDARTLAVFDIIANNADRKGGHILRDPTDTLWAIDHGVTFAVEPKLRTVLWGWMGSAIPAETLADIQRLHDSAGLQTALGPWLDPLEIAATSQRMAALLAHGIFPEPSAHWPAVPWPVL